MAWFLPAAVLAGSAISAGASIFGANKSASQSMKYAKYQHQSNMELLKYQLEYNSPAAQMARFKEAGLNPNLVYGQGSPGNMESPPRHPDIQVPDYAKAYGQAGQSLVDGFLKVAQMNLVQSQADLNTQKIDESTTKAALNNAQQDVLKANPWLKPEYVNATITQLESVAKLKSQEAKWSLAEVVGPGRLELDRSSTTTAGMVKMDLELQQLYQKFDLNQADQKIKAQVFESKEFQNALQELQVKWMKDGSITPQHIYQGIMLILSKLMR